LVIDHTPALLVLAAGFPAGKPLPQRASGTLNVSIAGRSKSLLSQKLRR
jgi:hypothetical protein